MRIPSTQPIRFATADLLAPEDLSATFRFAGECLDEASSKRWQHGSMVLQFVESVTVPYTNATNALVRTFHFLCPQTCIIESASFTANMTSAAPVEVAITATSGGATPQGATTPWLSTLGAFIFDVGDGTTSQSVDGIIADVADTITSVAPNRVLLVAGTEYTIALTSTGVFSLSRFDLQLNCLTDRWTTAGTSAIPSYAPALVTDAAAPDATAVSANISTLTTETNKLAANVVAAMPFIVWRHSIISTTDADLRTFSLPRFASSRAQARIIRAILRVEMIAAGGAGQTITAVINPGALVTLTATMTGVLAGVGRTVDSGIINIPLAGAVSSATTTDDYSILITNSAAAPTADKVEVLLWISR